MSLRAIPRVPRRRDDEVVRAGGVRTTFPHQEVYADPMRCSFEMPRFVSAGRIRGRRQGRWSNIVAGDLVGELLVAGEEQGDRPTFLGSA